MAANKPNYQIYTLPLTVAGRQDLPVVGTRVVMIAATDVNGNAALGAGVSLSIGRALGDPLPLSINSKVYCAGGFEFIRVIWAAQPGLQVTLLVSDDRQGTGVDMSAPPSTQLVTTSAGVAVATSQLLINTGAGQLILPASGSRQKGLIRNRGSGALYVGAAGVTAATGFAVDPGEAMTIDGTTAAIYGTASTANTPVHTFTEG
jgi:hypothetical protein